MNRRQMKKALKQARGENWPRRVRWLPANHPERMKWWNRRMGAVFRWLQADQPYGGHGWAVAEWHNLVLETDNDFLDPWRPVYYSGAARRRAHAALRAEELRLGLGDCPF